MTSDRFTRLVAAMSMLLLSGACGSGSGPDVGEGAWQYVALGDSWTGWASWPELYADYIEQDLGVEVMFHDEARPSQRADRALERIQTNPRLRALLSDADVITIGIVGNELAPALRAFVAADGTCGGSDDQECLREGFAYMKAMFEETLDELLLLRSPDEALITTFTKGVMLAERACGWGNDCYQVLASHFIDLAEFVKVAADERGLRVADALRALHDPGPFEGPINDAYVVDDRVHFTDDGSAVIAQLLRDLGYG